MYLRSYDAPSIKIYFLNFITTKQESVRSMLCQFKPALNYTFIGSYFMHTVYNVKGGFFSTESRTQSIALDILGPGLTS